MSVNFVRAKNDHRRDYKTATSCPFTQHIPAKTNIPPHGILSLIFSCSGPLGKASIWRSVWGVCLFNAVVALALCVLDHTGLYKCTISIEAHKVTSPLLAFLLATRTNIAYNRYMEGRESFGSVLCACREIVQQAITYSKHTGVDNDKPETVKWRGEIARMTVAVLHGITCTLHNPTDKSLVIYQPYLHEAEQNRLLELVGGSGVPHVTLLLALWLRTTISSAAVDSRLPLSALQYMELDRQVGKLVAAFHALTKLTSTPLPFPLVQMARTFLSVWCLTLPFALHMHIGDWNPVACFFISFGFYGLEYVAIELDDPFGDDENDLDIFGMAESVISDIRLFLCDGDGSEADWILGERVVDDAPRSWTGERIHSKRNFVDMVRNRKSGGGERESKGWTGRKSDRDAHATRRSSVEENTSRTGGGGGSGEMEMEEGGAREGITKLAKKEQSIV